MPQIYNTCGYEALTLSFEGMHIFANQVKYNYWWNNSGNLNIFIFLVEKKKKIIKCKHGIYFCL